MTSDTSRSVQMTEQLTNQLFQDLQREITALNEIAPAFADASPADIAASNGSDNFDGKGVKLQTAEGVVDFVHQQIKLHQTTLQSSLQQLQQRVLQLETLYTIANQYGEDATIDRIIASATEAIWQRSTLNFLVVILGESELGPYHYHSMRGVVSAWQYVNNPCPFPLWGLLARALLPRLNPDEPDYFVVNDIADQNLPRCEEFPWMPRQGSLMILPLRANSHPRGAILLGSKKINDFAEEIRCRDYLTIAFHTTRVLELSQMTQELNERAGQLLSLQLFTKSIAAAHSYNKLVDVLFEGIFEAMGQVGVSILFGDQSWHRETDGTGLLPDAARRIIEWAMQAGQPIFYDPDDSEGSLERFYYNDSGYALVVPILRNERTQGAIQITTVGTRRFDEGDLIVLRTIANCAAIILRELDV